MEFVTTKESQFMSLHILYIIDDHTMQVRLIPLLI